MVLSTPAGEETYRRVPDRDGGVLLHVVGLGLT